MSEVDLTALATQVLAAQPFSTLVGARLTSCEPGLVELTIPLRPEHRQQHGFVHGGVLAYAADNSITFAGGSVLGPAVVTGEMKINYVKPARGARLVARARVVHGGKRQAVCSCEIHVGDDELVLCAVALGTVNALEPR